MSTVNNLEGAAEFFQGKADKANAWTAKQQERIKAGEAAWTPPQPFALLEVIGIPITLTFETNLDDDGNEKTKCKLVQSISTKAYNKILGLTSEHSKGPIETNQFGTFMKHTINSKQQQDVELMAKLNAMCADQKSRIITSGAIDYEMTNRAGLMLAGWYGGFVRIE